MSQKEKNAKANRACLAQSVLNKIYDLKELADELQAVSTALKGKTPIPAVSDFEVQTNIFCNNVKQLAIGLSYSALALVPVAEDILAGKVPGADKLEVAGITEPAGKDFFDTYVDPMAQAANEAPAFPATIGTL